MPVPRRVEFAGKVQEFPPDTSDAEISAALGAIPASNASQAPKAKTWAPMDISRIPDPEGGLALSQVAEANPKAAVGGAVAGMVAPFVPAAVGLGTRAAAAAAEMVSPDLVGIVSPRLAHALRVAQKVVEASKVAVPAAAAGAKMNVNATDFIRIKSLIEQGISQGEAVKTVMNLRTLGKLP